MTDQNNNIKLLQSNDNGDFNIVDGLLEIDGGLQTAAYLALFGGNDDDDGSAGSNKNWWGNIGEEKVKQYRSETQYLLKGLPATSNNLKRVKNAVIRDLSFFIREKIASSIDVSVTIPKLNWIKISIKINANGEEIEFAFIENWKLDIILNTSIAVPLPVPPPEIPLFASCPTLWSAGSHPADTSGSQRARFNGDYNNPFYLLLGGTGSAGEMSWSATGNGDFVSGSTNCLQYCIDAAYDDVNLKWITVGWPLIIENSNDGKTFTSRFWPGTLHNPSGIACSGGTCIVVTDNMEYALRTTNGGDTWSLTGLFSITPQTFRSVATDGAGVWLAAYDGGVYKSTDDGLTFSLVGVYPAGTVNRELIWASGLSLWVAVIGQYIHTSPDGATWTQRYNAVSWNFLRVAYSNAGCLIAVGFNGNAVKSIDAITWTPISIGVIGVIGGILVSYDKWIATTSTELYTGTP